MNNALYQTMNGMNQNEVHTTEGKAAPNKNLINISSHSNSMYESPKDMMEDLLDVGKGCIE